MSTMESKLPDADMQAVPRALLRAARSAREIARRTGTAVVVVKNGVLVEESVGPDRDSDFAEDNTKEEKPGAAGSAPAQRR